MAIRAGREHKPVHDIEADFLVGFLASFEPQFDPHLDVVAKELDGMGELYSEIVRINHGADLGLGWLSEGWTTAMGLFTSGLGAHLTRTLPFGLLIMFAIFNRFDGRLEEAARDLGATPWQSFRHVVLPIILPSVVGIGLFGFTLSWDELARSSQAIGSVNTLPLDLQGLTTTVTKPDIYALGTITSSVSFVVIFVALGMMKLLQARQMRHGSDAGKGLV